MEDVLEGLEPCYQEEAYSDALGTLWGPLLTVTAAALGSVEVGATQAGETLPELRFLVRHLFATEARRKRAA